MQIKLLTTLLLSCLCFIKIGAYSHVAIIQIAFESESYFLKSKRFFSQSSLQAFEKHNLHDIEMLGWCPGGVSLVLPHGDKVPL